MDHNGKDNKNFLLVLYVIIAYSIFTFILTEILKDSLVYVFLFIFEEMWIKIRQFITNISSREVSFEQNTEETGREHAGRAQDPVSPKRNNIVEDNLPIDIPEF